MSPDERKLRTKLRLATARLFTLRLRDAEFRANFSKFAGWAPQSPIVPCEYDTVFGEVHDIVVDALKEGEADIAIIPVLFFAGKKTQNRPTLHVLSIGIHPMSEGSIELGSVNPQVTMGQLVETLSPNKMWDVRLLDNEIDSHNFSGLH